MNQYRSKKNSKPSSKASKSVKKIAEAKKQPHKYKTILCKNFGEATGCKFGDTCIFAHGQDQLVKVDDCQQDDVPQAAPVAPLVSKKSPQEAKISYDWLKTHLSDDKSGDEMAPAQDSHGEEEKNIDTSEPQEDQLATQVQQELLPNNKLCWSENLRQQPESLNLVKESEKVTMGQTAGQTGQNPLKVPRQIYSAILDSLQEQVSATLTSEKLKSESTDDRTMNEAAHVEVDPTCIFNSAKIPELRLTHRLLCFQQICATEPEMTRAEECLPTSEESKEEPALTVIAPRMTTIIPVEPVQNSEEALTRMQTAWLGSTTNAPLDQKVTNKWEHTLLTRGFPSISELEELQEQSGFDTTVRSRGRKFRKQRTYSRVEATPMVVSAY